MLTGTAHTLLESQDIFIKKEQTATLKTVCHNMKIIKYDVLANHPKISFVPLYETSVLHSPL